LAVDEAAVRSRHIDKQNKKDFRAESRIVKLLLLGTGGSGKSTIVKQMKLLHGLDGNSQTGMSDEEREAYVETCRSNVLDSIYTILTTCNEIGFDIPPDLTNAGVRVKKAIESILSGNDGISMVNNSNLLSSHNLFVEDAYTSAVAADISSIWAEASIQKLATRITTLFDSAPYFLENAQRLASEDYLPTDEDILRARTMTSGIVVVPFQSKDLKFELVDVGGQRSERKKWIQCFDNVTAVLFIISLSDFNQVLYEDNLTNRMRESEKLFGEILNCIFFRQTPFIVFFNKVDLFKEKLKFSKLSDYLPEYSGSQDYSEALRFLKRKYLRMNKNLSRDIYSFETTATDTNLVKIIFGSISEIILNKILSKAGFE